MDCQRRGYVRRSRSSHSINSRTFRRFARHNTSKASPNQWHCTQCTIERHVAEHAHDDVTRRAELVGLVHDKQRQRRGCSVANNGKEPDQPIDAKAYAGAGDDEGGVEQGSKRVDPRDASATRARAR